MKAYVFLLLLATVFAEEATKLYPGDKVFRLVPSTHEHLDWLQKMRQDANPDIHDFWTEPSSIDVPVDIHVTKDALEKFQEEAERMKIDLSTNIHDLQKLIDEVDAVALSRKRREARFGKNRADVVGKFAKYADIVTWLASLCGTYPTLASCGSVGTSYEKRDIRYIKIGSEGTNKQVIIIEGGIHAREWLGVATATYLINRMLTTYNTDETAKRMLDTYDFYIVPVVNTDGYEYSQKERMWRKTRSRHNGALCYGVDPNRNYDMNWGSSGSSSSPCSDIYRGPSAFSEPETKAMSEFINARKSQTLAFFTLHTYSQLWLVPYGDKKGHYCPDYNELLRVANIGTKALVAVNKKSWQAGNTVDVLSAAAGGGDDWAKMIGIKYSYTLELRPAGSALNGFVVPESDIEPSGKEVWAGIMTAIEAMQP